MSLLITAGACGYVDKGTGFSQPVDCPDHAGSRPIQPQQGGLSTASVYYALSTAPASAHPSAMPERTGPVPLKDCIDELLVELLKRDQRDLAHDDVPALWEDA